MYFNRSTVKERIRRYNCHNIKRTMTFQLGIVSRFQHRHSTFFEPCVRVWTTRKYNFLFCFQWIFVLHWRVISFHYLDLICNDSVSFNVKSDLRCYLLDHGWLDTAVVLHCRLVLLRRMKLFTIMEETSLAETYKFSSAAAYTLKHNYGA